MLEVSSGEIRNLKEEKLELVYELKKINLDAKEVMNEST